MKREIPDLRPMFMRQIPEYNSSDMYGRCYILIASYDMRNTTINDVLAAGYKLQPLGPSNDISEEHKKKTILGCVLHLCLDLDILSLELFVGGSSWSFQVSGKAEEFEWGDEQNYSSWSALRLAMEEIHNMGWKE